jgi:hypothetical protein
VSLGAGGCATTRARRAKVKYAQALSSIAIRRLRNPIRKWMCAIEADHLTIVQQHPHRRCVR